MNLHASAMAACRKRKKMTNSTDASDVDMTRFRQRVDLIKERHMSELKLDEAKITIEQRKLTGMIAYHC